MTSEQGENKAGRRFLALGCGYVATALALRLAGEGWAVAGTTRDGAQAKRLRAMGIEGLVFDGLETAGLVRALGAADAILVSIPPDDDGDAAVRIAAGATLRAGWIGYLSTTGVWGDRGGRWAFEWTPPGPQSLEGQRRLAAEDRWRALSPATRVFRLPGIYGPGRSALDRVAEPGARSVVKPGQVFSRAHRDDIAAALALSIARPDAGPVFAICDDEPAPPQTVNAFAAQLLGIAPPREVDLAEAGLSPMAQRFYAENKRVSNARAKAALGWRPAYPSYREGLAAILAEGSP